MKIYLIRHGETPGNAKRMLQFPDTPLSERGAEQARHLGERMRARQIAAVLVSDHARALSTADAICATTAAPLEVVQTLGERNFGEHRGKLIEQLTVDVFSEDYHPLGGESTAMFHERVHSAWQQATERALTLAGDIAVVCHGLVCRSVVERCVHLPTDLASTAFGFANTSVTEIAGPPWTVHTLACVAHLPTELVTTRAIRPATPTAGA